MPFKQRQSRAVEKPKRPSRSIKTLEAILDANEWKSMITFKPDCSTPTETNSWMETLYEMGKYAMRNESVGFLIKREFGDDNKHAHFHMVFTQPLKESVISALRKRFLKRDERENNRGRQFKYDCHDPSGKINQPRLREYLKKIRKGSMDTIHPPKGWSRKNLKRPYKFHKISRSKSTNSQTSFISAKHYSVIHYNWRRVVTSARYVSPVIMGIMPMNHLNYLNSHIRHTPKFPRYVPKAS